MSDEDDQKIKNNCDIDFKGVQTDVTNGNAKNEHEVDPILTAEEVSDQLKAELEDHELAVGLFGIAKEDKCTYLDGYKPRQALFSCLTCRENDKHPLLCYACSIQCHEEHSVIELFTKRNVRCDCPTHSCKIETLVIEPNLKNKYCHNSQKGEYCVCNRPFPDENDPIADSMYQCVVCEDWYHSRHLFTSDQVLIAPDSNEDPKITHKVIFKDQSLMKKLDSATCEVVCVGCRNKHSFLQDKSCICEKSNDLDLEKSKKYDSCLIFDNSRRIEWRSCEDCEYLLFKNKIAFLAEIEDSIYHFETVQKKHVENETKNYVESNFDHSAQMMIASGMQDLRKGLTDFLNERKRKGETLITEDSVRDFFSSFKKAKIQD